MPYTERREEKACERCGHKRVVKVTTYTRHPDDKSDLLWPGDSWEKKCTPCKDLLNAEGKFQEACRFWKKAYEAYAKQGKAPEERRDLMNQVDLTKALVGLSAIKKQG